MAMNLGGGSGIKADINVTPLVDVMLVLLIIVILVAPLVQQGVQLTLPIASNTTDHPETPEQASVAITANSTFWINNAQVARTDLRTSIEGYLEGKKDRLVLIKGDVGAEYADIMFAMDELRAAGVEDMALITDRRTQPGEGNQ